MNIVKAGSDSIIIDTAVISLIVCTDNHLGKDKRRYCIVHKRRTQQYAAQWCNAAGQPVSVVTTAVFNDVKEVLLSLQRQINDLKRDNEVLKTQVESYKIMIDTLRKNGVID